MSSHQKFHYVLGLKSVLSEDISQQFRTPVMAPTIA